MIFNAWRRYPKKKPKESGWYLVTTSESQTFRYENSRSYVRALYYYKPGSYWIDISRQLVFEGYMVYKVCRAPIEENHVYTDWLCKRGDVVAWKKLSKKYRRKR